MNRTLRRFREWWLKPEIQIAYVRLLETTFWMIIFLQLFLIFLIWRYRISVQWTLLGILLLIIREIAYMPIRPHRTMIRLLKFEQIFHEGDISGNILHCPEDRFQEQMSQWQENVTALRERYNNSEFLLMQAKMQALQNQINPHMLYNTLDTIRAQALIGGNRSVAEMAEALSTMFRYSIRASEGMVTLRQELENVENYVTIQKFRFEDRFRVEIAVDEEDENLMEAILPRLSLQPLVENSLQHGIDRMASGGAITVHAFRTDRHLIVRVRDNGAGMDQEALDRLNRRLRGESLPEGSAGGEHGGIALYNIHQRIRLTFGEEYGLSVSSAPGEGTLVEMQLPWQIQRKQERTAK